MKTDRYGDPIYPGRGVRVMMINGRPVVEDPDELLEGVSEALEGTVEPREGSAGLHPPREKGRPS